MCRGVAACSSRSAQLRQQFLQFLGKTGTADRLGSGQVRAAAFLGNTEIHVYPIEIEFSDPTFKENQGEEFLFVHSGQVGSIS